MASLEKTVLEIPLKLATDDIIRYIEMKLKDDLFDSSPWNEDRIYIFESGEKDTGDIQDKLMERKIPYNRYCEFYDTDSCLWVYRPENGQTEYFYESDFAQRPKIDSIPLWNILNKKIPPEKLVEEIRNYLNKVAPYFKPLKSYNRKK